MSCENNPNKAAKAAKQGGVSRQESKGGYHLGSGRAAQQSLFGEAGEKPGVSDSTKKMMLAMAEMGANPALLGALLGMAGFSKQHVRYLTGPVVVFGPGGWLDTLPGWLPQAVYRDRLEQIFNEEETGEVGELATPTEVLTYMYPASLAFPLRREWTHVYLWAGNEAMRRHGRLPEGKSFWEAIGEEPVRLSEYERREFLERLQRDIRRTVVNTARKREAAERRRRRAERTAQASLTEETEPQEQMIQLNLFGDVDERDK